MLTSLAPGRTEWFTVAREQPFTVLHPDGTQHYFLRGLQGDDDAIARLSANSYQRLRRFLAGLDPDFDIASDVTANQASARTGLEVWECGVIAASNGHARCFRFIDIS